MEREPSSSQSPLSNMVTVAMVERTKFPSSGVVGITALLITMALLFNSTCMQTLEPMSTGSFQLRGGSPCHNSEPCTSSHGDDPMTPASKRVGVRVSYMEPKKSTSSHPTYPLQLVGLPSAKEAYERGFWQGMDPVPMERWSAVSNSTCLKHTTRVSDWKRRVPHMIMIGSQKGGTTALSYYLYSHPSVQYLPPKELNFFDVELDKNPALLTNGSGIPAARLLDYYQGITIGEIVPLVQIQSKVKYALDATPNYLFLSDRVPQRILCVTPWVKLLAILRDPVDRAFSQYHMQYQRDLSNPENRRGSVSFEEYISLDMKVLQETGVLPRGYGGWHTGLGDDEASAKDFDTSILLTEEVTKAWSTYTKLGVNSPVGRGLYSIQLSQWFRAMDSFGKPRSDLLVLPSERLLNAPNATYSEIIDFLGLPPHFLEEYSTTVHETNYEDAQMQPEMRAKLQAFFLPFNRQLKDLLLGHEWDGIWNQRDEP